VNTGGRYCAQPPPPLTVNSAASRAVHGANGPTFDIDLPLSGTPAIECRTGDGSGDGNYTIVFSFSNPISSVDSITPSCGSVASNGVDANNSNHYIVQLSSATCNQQYVTVSLSGVHDTYNQALASAGVTMGLLVGDTTGDGSVNVADIGQTKSQSGQPVTISNFREDVTVDGSIDIGDIGLVKSKSGNGLPP
jgi:hypothetical protein